MARSTPSSPAVTARRPGQGPLIAPRSAPAAPDDKSQKLQALRIPLVHLVAIRPMSLKFLANKVGCSQDECRQVLEKVGKPFRLDPEKWDLSDKAFKDLDVWKFAYEHDNDRELAIEHAISAYDRMRLSREDQLWQTLLPKAERGKGKVLSKLQLHQGPIQKSGTPRIHVQRTTEDPVNDNTMGVETEEKHRLTPVDATPMARSQSSDQIKKKRVSEQEAQSKRLLSSKPKKPAATPKANDTTKKKAPKKGATTGPTVKSAEFVHDSDEGENMEDVVTTATKPTTAKAAVTLPKSLPKPTAPDADDSIKRLQQLEKDRKRVTKPAPDASKRHPPTAGTSSPNHRLSDASQSSKSTSKLSRQRTTSSPLKPSPLGSSPPTNASDLENGSQRPPTSNSSTSSTPLITQARSAPLTTKPRPDAAKRLPNGVENTSEHSLKRKANDIDSGIHNHNVPLTNGHFSPAPKRVKPSAPSPPAMDSSSESSPISNSLLTQAQRFKDYYANYESVYREVSTQTNPAAEKVDRLVKMHNRLQTMKEEIARAAVRG